MQLTSTNFVLHTFGHPLHAFDADTIGGNTVNIRASKSGRKACHFRRSGTRTLDPQDCIIADAY